MLYNFSLAILLISFLFSTLFSMEPKISCELLYTTMEEFLRNYRKKDADKKTINFLKQCSESIQHDNLILDNLIIYAYEQRKNLQYIQFALSKKYIITYSMQLKEYFNTLQNKQYTTPTHEQFKHHLENIELTNTTNQTIQRAHLIGIHLYIEDMSSDLSFHIIPNTIALEEFKTLLDNTTILLYKEPSELRDTEQAIYKKIKKLSGSLNNL